MTDIAEGDQIRFRIFTASAVKRPVMKFKKFSRIARLQLVSAPTTGGTLKSIAN